MGDSADYDAPRKPRRGGAYSALTEALIRDAGDLLGPCVHCGEPIKAAAHDWTHVHGRSRCQSPLVAYGHLAHPSVVPCRADGPNPCLGARTSVIPPEVGQR